jgi:hypothetical protein
MALPYEQARTLWVIGRSAPAALPARRAHLARAAAIFETIGATYELDQVRAAISP